MLYLYLLVSNFFKYMHLAIHCNNSVFFIYNSVNSNNKNWTNIESLFHVTQGTQNMWGFFV